MDRTINTTTDAMYQMAVNESTKTLAPKKRIRTGDPSVNPPTGDEATGIKYRFGDPNNPLFSDYLTQERL